MRSNTFPNSYTEGRLNLYRSQTKRKPPKWNVCPQITDHLPSFKAEFSGHSKDMHEQEAEWCAQQAQRAKVEWNRLYEENSKKFELSDHPISGIAYGGKFPHDVRTRLGDLARMETTFIDAAFAHWIASGHRRNTFHALRAKHHI